VKIKISLPHDRSSSGTLEVQTANGHAIFGPVPVAGRAHNAAAAAHNNPLRDPLLPYGDTPCGAYRVRAVVKADTKSDVAYHEDYGPHGVIVLEPTAGDAVLADAHGRFRFLIQGSAGRHDKRLRATSGALRLFNRDQLRLVALLGDIEETVTCEVSETTSDGFPVIEAVQSKFLEDPPPLHQDEWLRQGAQSNVDRLPLLTRRAALAQAALLALAGSGVFMAHAAAARPAEGITTAYGPLDYGTISLVNNSQYNLRLEVRGESPCTAPKGGSQCNVSQVAYGNYDIRIVDTDTGKVLEQTSVSLHCAQIIISEPEGKITECR
jgi:hypothetical protein